MDFISIKQLTNWGWGPNMLVNLPKSKCEQNRRNKQYQTTRKTGGRNEESSKFSVKISC